MEETVIYKVYGIKRDGTRELVASYSDPNSAHDAAMRWTKLFQAMQIEKRSAKS